MVRSFSARTQKLLRASMKNNLLCVSTRFYPGTRIVCHPFARFQLRSFALHLRRDYVSYLC